MPNSSLYWEHYAELMKDFPRVPWHVEPLTSVQIEQIVDLQKMMIDCPHSNCDGWEQLLSEECARDPPPVTDAELVEPHICDYRIEAGRTRLDIKLDDIVVEEIPARKPRGRPRKLDGALARAAKRIAGRKRGRPRKVVRVVIERNWS
jgi:hypothetical protein